MTESHVLAVLEGFADWSRPWTFLETVLTHEGLSPADRREIRGLWAHACSSAHWQARDLSVGAELAACALHQTFPWLSLAARRQLVRAAAYEWK